MIKSFNNKKPCNSNSPKASDGKHVCNEKTGVWVSKTGKIGKEILKGGGKPTSPKKGKKKEGCDPSSPKATSGKHVCNEKTVNWVLMSSKTGKEILKNEGGSKHTSSKKTKGECDPSSPKATSGKHVCNDKTGNWVLKTSKIGKEILKQKISVKPKSPKTKSPKTISPQIKSPKTISQKPKSPPEMSILKLSFVGQPTNKYAIESLIKKYDYDAKIIGGTDNYYQVFYLDKNYLNFVKDIIDMKSPNLKDIQFIQYGQPPVYLYNSETKSKSPKPKSPKPKSPKTISQKPHVNIQATSPTFSLKTISKEIKKHSPGAKPISMSLPNIKSKMDIQPHQVRFAKAFMKMTDKPFDKYGGIAVHSLGSGKTMTAITTSQMYLEKYPNDKVIVITPASLITNFQKEMDKWGVKNKEKYNFFTYDGFKNNPINCTDSLLIVDEAHNLRTEVKLDDAQKTKIGKTKQNAKGQGGSKVTMRKSGDNFVITGEFTKTTPISIAQQAFPNFTVELTPTKFKITGKLSDKETLIDLFNHNSNFFLDGYQGVQVGGEKEQNKNKGMKAADIINCAKKARFVLLLTGTPVVNDMYDIENLMAMIYKREPLSKYKFDKMNADAMAEYFKCAISMYSTMNNAEVKKDFPETKDHNIFIEMTPDYLAKYKIIEDNLVGQFGAVGFKDDKDITKFYNGLRQATTKIDNENSPKAKWIMNLLEKSKPNEKFVVFSHFKDAGVGLLSKLFDKAKIKYRVISGEIPKAKRQEYVDEYNKNKIKVLIITKAGGEGLNLLETRGIVLIEPSWNETTSNQVIGRAVRYKSHITLPKEDQIVDIYKLYMLKPEEKKLMDKTLGKNSLHEVVEMLENKPGNDKPSIDIYLKAHSMEKQDKLDRFLDFFKSIPSFEDCYIKGDTVVKQEKLQGMTTKNLTIKDNVTFDFKTWGDYKQQVENLFKNVFKEYTLNQVENDDLYNITVPAEQIVKLTNDNIAYFIKKFKDMTSGKPKITTKSNNPQIKANVAKLNLKSALHAYLPDNDLEALNIYIQHYKPIDDSKLKAVIKNNPFTKDAQVIGPIKNNILSAPTYIISVSPDEDKHYENLKNLKKFGDDVKKEIGAHINFSILSNKKEVYANTLQNQYWSY